MLIYVICHDENSETKANGICEKLNNQESISSKVVRLKESHKLFESQIFLYLDDNRSEWIHEDFVGMVTYSIEDKLNLSVEEMLSNMRKVKELGADIIPIYRMTFEKRKLQHTIPYIEAATIMHGPYYLLAYKEILDTLGYTEVEYFNDAIPSYFCNWWIVRPEYMCKYLTFFKQCLHVIENNNRIQRYLNKHSYYDGKMSEEALIKATGKPYYTLHPFLFERLPCFFFYNLGIKHGLISDGKYYLHDYS